MGIVSNFRSTLAISGETWWRDAEHFRKKSNNKKNKYMLLFFVFFLEINSQLLNLLFIVAIYIKKTFVFPQAQAPSCSWHHTLLTDNRRCFRYSHRWLRHQHFTGQNVRPQTWLQGEQQSGEEVTPSSSWQFNWGWITALNLEFVVWSLTVVHDSHTCGKSDWSSLILTTKTGITPLLYSLLQNLLCMPCY